MDHESPSAGDLPACTVVLDVGHNPPAIAELAKMLTRRFPNRPVRLVLGMSREKDLGESLKLALASPSLVHVHLVAAPHPRAAPVAELLEAAQVAVSTGTTAAPGRSDSTEEFFSVHDSVLGSVTSGLRAAVTAAAGSDEIVVVCGSVFIMAEAREALGFKDPRDAPYVNDMATGSNTKSADGNGHATASSPMGK